MVLDQRTGKQQDEASECRLVSLASVFQSRKRGQARVREPEHRTAREEERKIEGQAGGAEGKA